jgi:thiamine pyrophosphate-dependent acetolactate synthase large subunit-like protein
MENQLFFRDRVIKIRENDMNGAEILIQTLCDYGVDICFVNPGTSEKLLVAAIDGEPRMHGSRFFR